MHFLNTYRINFTFGPHLDLETICSFKHNFSLLGILNCRAYNHDYSSSYFSSIRVKDVEAYSSFLSVNIYLRNEIPLLNTRVRKSNNYYMSSFKFFCAGVGTNYFTYPVMLVSNNVNSLNRVLIGKSYLSKTLMKLKNRFVVFYKQDYFYLFSKFFKLFFSPAFIKIDNSLSDLMLSHLGLKNQFFVKHGYEANCFYSIGLDTSLEYSPLIYQGHHGNNVTVDSLIIMPVPVFSEKSSHFLNLEGLTQKSHAAVSHDKLVRKDWEIFMALIEFNSLLNLNSIKPDYITSIFYNYSIKLPNFFPFWVENTNYFGPNVTIGGFLKNSLFSIRILNYY